MMMTQALVPRIFVYLFLNFQASKAIPITFFMQLTSPRFFYILEIFSTQITCTRNTHLYGERKQIYIEFMLYVSKQVFTEVRCLTTLAVSRLYSVDCKILMHEKRRWKENWQRKLVYSKHTHPKLLCHNILQMTWPWIEPKNSRHRNLAANLLNCGTAKRSFK